MNYITIMILTYFLSKHIKSAENEELIAGLKTSVALGTLI